MTLEQATQIESSQRQLFNQLQHEEAMIALGMENDYKLFSILKPQLFRVNDHWQCLYGSEGLIHFKEQIRGTGNTPRDAVVDWNNKWNGTQQLITHNQSCDSFDDDICIVFAKYCPLSIDAIKSIYIAQNRNLSETLKAIREEVGHAAH